MIISVSFLYIYFFICYEEEIKPVIHEPVIGYYDYQGYPVTLAPTFADFSAKNLSSLQSNLLQQDYTEFIRNMMDRKKEINKLLTKNAEEIDKIRKAINEKTIKSHVLSDLKYWLRVKNDERKLLLDEQHLIEDILMAITKIEAAKYIARSKSVDKMKSFVPYSDILLPDDASAFHNQDVPRSTIQKYSSNNINSEKDFIDLDAKYEIKDNAAINKHKKSQPIAIKKTENNAGALSTISYIQKMISLDPDNTAKLITEAKSLVQKEIDLKQNLLNNHENLKKLESVLSKRNLMDRNSKTYLSKDIENLKSDLEESKKRLWNIKEIEWIITQIETAKFFARLKQRSNNDKEFHQKISKLIQDS